MPVFKARRVIDQIRLRSYEETLMILKLIPYGVSYPILKLVYSAAANASGFDEADSFISEVKVNRSTIMKKLRPQARGRSYPRARIEELDMNVQKEFHSVNRRVNIAITRVEKPYGQHNVLAECIALQLKNKVSFRKAMKKAIELAEQTDTKGMQVQIVGRIDGKEIARVEWIKEGRVPLQTIHAKIDHCSYTIRTIYGVLGIKIWIFVDKE
ncbi:unnamed protein product [Musa banksii]